MHIEEEEPTFMNRIKKERVFTQYFIQDGHRYARDMITPRGEFDGSLSDPSDVKKLEALFEDLYKGYDPDEYDCYDEDDDDDDDDDYSRESAWDSLIDDTVEFAVAYFNEGKGSEEP